MSFRDVTIETQDRGFDQGCEWRHAEKVDFRLLAEALWFGADGKVSIERYLSPYVKKTFQLKVIKSFVPELMYYSHIHMQNHNDTIIKTQGDFFINICTSHFIVRVRKGLLSGLRVRGSWRPNRNCNILTPLLWPATLCLSCSPDAQLEAQRLTLLGDGFLYCILSTTSLDPNSSEPQSPFGLMWLSLPHLVYNSVRSLTGTDQRPQGPFGLRWLYLPHSSCSDSNSNWNSNSVSTELYNSSRPTQSPTRSLEIACLIVIKQK